MNTEQITTLRLGDWANRLKEENATPLILVGLGHEHKSGQLVLCVPEGPSDDLIVGALRFALASIQGQSLPQKHGERKEFP